MDNISLGFFTVNVRYANGASPVRDGRVVLKRGEGFFGEFVTDMDGKISPIPLAEEDKYNITVYADGFYQREYVDIPIYSGITTIQNVNLFPKGGEENE